MKKEKGKLRVCVDYIDLNKACPKDLIHVSPIDLLVDSTSGNQLLSFLDAYSGYNQIAMYELGKGKTAFMIEQGTYCYKGMPFGPNNAGATYQRFVSMMFKKQIGVIMEVYVDDIMVNGKQRSDHIRNLAETFDILRKYKMKLNPTKCTFGVSLG
ncbi:hypothetical protein ACFXTN_010737 [Malus domestica]